MKNYIFFLLLILLISCTSNYYHEPISQKEIIHLELPIWLLNIPGEDYEIGISPVYEDEKEEEKQAKEFATVNINRNLHSYVITNKAEIKNENSIKFKDLNINVSSTKDSLNKIYSSLKLIKHIHLSGYFIGLFSKKSNSKKISDKKVTLLSIPDWYDPFKIKIEGNHIYVCAKSSSLDLDSAIFKAMEKARYKIARYKVQEIKSMIKETNQNTEKVFSIESKTIVKKLNTTNIFVVENREDKNLFSYDVYIRMRGEK